MNILIIAPCKITPNASAGGETINTYIKFFADFGNEVKVIAPTEGKYRNNRITYHTLNIETKGQRTINKVVKGVGWLLWPQNQYLYKTSRKFRNDLSGRMRRLKKQGYNPDVIILETTSIVLLYDIVRSIYPDTLLVASMHDIAYQGSMRKAELEQNGLMMSVRKRYLKYAKRNEVHALKEMDLIVLFNMDNLKLLKENGGLEDIRYFHLVPDYYNEFNHNDNEHTMDIIFYGLMSRLENYLSAEWFIDKVMPKLSPEFRFIIMGGNPPQYLQDKASEKIVVTGFVEDDIVKNYFEKSFCMVVPLVTGSGIKTKVLSALAAGLPVFTNHIGIEGVPAVSARDYIHCESAEEYVRAFCEMTDEKYRNLCMNSRRLMKETFSREQCAVKYVQQLEELYRRKKIDAGGAND